MPTVCELQIEAKKRGLRGYSKLKKSELEALVNKKASSPPKTMTIKVKKSKLDAIRKKKAPTPAKAPTPVKSKNAKDLFDEIVYHIEGENVYTDFVDGESDDYIENKVRWLGRMPNEEEQEILLERGHRHGVRILKKMIKEWIKENKNWKKMSKNEIITKVTKYLLD